MKISEKYLKTYPKTAISWHSNWANLSTYFKYPQEVRTLIYTTNTTEGFNRQLRKVTKNKEAFPTDDSLLKMLYLAMMDISKKWTEKRRENLLDYFAILEFIQILGQSLNFICQPLFINISSHMNMLSHLTILCKSYQTTKKLLIKITNSLMLKTYDS